MRTTLRPNKKVLHILQGFGAGGAELWLLATARYLQDHPDVGLHFDFLATGGQPDIFDEEVKKTGSKIFYIKYSKGGAIRFRKQLKVILEKESYDAIHDHQDFISGWHFLLSAGQLPPILISHLHNPYNFVRNYVVNPERWFSFRVGRVLTALFTTKITGTSNAVMDEYGYDKWPYKAKRVFPTYCGFDVKEFCFNEAAGLKIRGELGWQELDKIILFVGRIGLQDVDTAANQKNPAFAFSLAKKLVTENEGWRFLFVGFKGIVGEQMEQEVAAKGLTQSIRFTGLRTDIPAIMSASNVLIFPSLWEGLGMVAVEAQACGLPVVMSDTVPSEAIICEALVKMVSLNSPEDFWINAVKEALIINNKRTEFSIPVQNSPFSITNSIRRMNQLYSRNGN
jgi:glycosyltransferase involved in cell wall biosynthesis